MITQISWSIACRRCSIYIFIPDLIPGLNGLDKDNSTARRDENHLRYGAAYIRDFTAIIRVPCVNIQDRHLKVERTRTTILLSY